MQFITPQLTKERKVTWLELFYDLIFVVAISQMAHIVPSRLDVKEISQFLLIFLLVWWAWISQTIYTNRFGTHDRTERTIFFVQMFATIVLSVFLPRAFGRDSSAFALSYIIIRLLTCIFYARVAYGSPRTIRGTVNRIIFGFLFGLSFFAISIFVTPPTRYVLWGIGLILEVCTPLFINRNGRLKMIPIHSGHLIERLGLFSIIILGEMVLSLVKTLTRVPWVLESLLAITAAFTLIISLWWIYFELLDNYDKGKMLFSSGHFFTYSHLPLQIGLIFIAEGLRNAVPQHSNVANWELWFGTVLFLIPFSYLVYKNLKLPHRKQFLGLASGTMITLLIASYILEKSALLIFEITVVFLFYATIVGRWYITQQQRYQRVSAAKE